jgi:hypothetical protein
MSGQFPIEVEYRGEIKGGHRLKLLFYEWGAFSDGWTARPGKKPEDGWWIQSPARRWGPKWISLIEFSADSPFYAAIKKACTDCIAAHEAEEARLSAELPGGPGSGKTDDAENWFLGNIGHIPSIDDLEEDEPS